MEMEARQQEQLQNSKYEVQKMKQHVPANKWQQLQPTQEL